MHRLLERQLRRSFGSEDSFPDSIRAFVRTVDEAYHQADEDRQLLEHSMETVSRELVEHNRQLRRSEQYFRSLIENSSDIITILAPDGRICYESPSVERILGYRPGELIGRSIFEFIHPDHRGRTARAVAHRFAHADVGEAVEFRFLHQDGSWRVLEARASDRSDDPAINGLVVNARDVTERRRAEEELEKSLSLLHASLEATADGILVVDLEGRTTSANAAFTQMWRIPAELLATHDDERMLAHVLEQLHDPEEFLAKVRVLYGDPEAESMDLVRFRDGRLFERFSKPQRLGEQVVGRVWSFRDVTEQRHLEEQLRHSQKMEAVGKLAGGVAHDFNNLLTAIRGFSELLGLELPPDEAMHAYLGEIQKAAERATSLTRQLLAFSRKQVLKPEVLDLNAVVGDMDKLLRRLIGEDIELRIELAPQLRPVRADRGQIEQVVLNLVVNARDAMPHGGTLTIATRNLPRASGTPGTHTPAVEGQQVALTVADTGCGMDEPTQERIFEPFFTTKPDGRGTGLGLSTVYGIVDQSGGSIRVHSQVGAGSTFEILLPAGAGARVENAESAPSLDTVTRTGSEVILLVEDEPAVRSLFRRVLVSRGYRVLEAGNGREALELCEQHREPIDLVLTDVVMPELSGRAMVERLEQLRPGIRTLYMSGYTEDSALRRDVLASGCAFLQKPFTLDTLVRRVRDVLDAPAPAARAAALSR